MVREIVGRGTGARNRDYVDKRRDYAKAGIAEYWMLDPEENLVTVLSLERAEYEEVGCFRVGQTAMGRLLPKLNIDVDSLMRA